MTLPERFSSERLSSGAARRAWGMIVGIISLCQGIYFVTASGIMLITGKFDTAPDLTHFGQVISSCLFVFLGLFEVVLGVCVIVLLIRHYLGLETFFFDD